MAVEIEKKDVVWNYLGTIASLGSNLVMVPILMFFLDSDLLGLWQIFTSIGAIALLLDFHIHLKFVMLHLQNSHPVHISLYFYIFVLTDCPTVS